MKYESTTKTITDDNALGEIGSIKSKLKKILPEMVEAMAPYSTTADALRGVLQGGSDYIRKAIRKDTAEKLAKIGITAPKSIDRYAQDALDELGEDFLKTIDKFKNEIDNTRFSAKHVGISVREDDLIFKDGKITIVKSFDERMNGLFRHHLTEAEEDAVTNLMNAMQTLRLLQDNGYKVRTQLTPNGLDGGIFPIYGAVGKLLNLDANGNYEQPELTYEAVASALFC